MAKKHLGFTLVETLITIVVVIAIAGAGYYVYHNHKTKNSNQSATGQTVPAASPGSTQAINSLMNQMQSSSSSIDNNYTNKDQTAADSSNAAAGNLGGAYDESTF